MEKHTHSNKTTPEDTREISAEKALHLMKNDPRTVVIDIRSSGETCLGHLKGARFVPLGLIEGELNKLTGDRDAPVLVYCGFGDRSINAAERLRKMGFTNAHSIAGGYDGWLNAGLEIVADCRLTVQQLTRYSRNMLLPEIGEEGQVKLLEAKVLMVGAGGLASSAGLYLAACGVGTIGIADYDWVDLSNLNRQVFHGTHDVGQLKVNSAKASIERINPEIRVITYAMRLTPENTLDIVKEYDIIMDASDNAGTKFLLNDTCFFAGKPYVFGGAVGFDGQATVYWPKEKGPCIRCLFPKPPPRALAPTCSEAGVLGVVPGQIGLIQATEVIKLILGIGTPMIGKYLVYNALTMETRLLGIGKNPDCALCGTNPTITGLVGDHSIDYDGGVCTI